MSRRWIQNPNRCSDEYLDGIEDFIEFARRHNPGATRIRCPCRRCNNTLWETIKNVGFHLVRNGMIETYSIWNLLGEKLDHASSSNATRMDSVEPIVDPNDQVIDIIEDVFPFASTNINHERKDNVPTPIDSAEFEQYKPRVIPRVRELFRSHGHCRANARKNKVSYVEPVFRLLFGGFQENASDGQLFAERS
ncbi:hypothetical protein L3X38_041525 [Prunus dulcis]|uniref:Transposase-associated domain-containing protein n=1 Tax=Prunus dulcis TaxID=3755 RepID=A0AAD4YJA9_PRUDU|nr:hypothetical protein L3X38_041525 [Prunus dulcis]